MPVACKRIAYLFICQLDYLFMYLFIYLVIYFCIYSFI